MYFAIKAKYISIKKLVSFTVYWMRAMNDVNGGKNRYYAVTKGQPLLGHFLSVLFLGA